MELSAVTKILILALLNHSFECILCKSPALNKGSIEDSNPQIKSHYRFIYAVKDHESEKVNSSEKFTNGTNVNSSYKIIKPNDNIRVFNYTPNENSSLKIMNSKFGEILQNFVGSVSTITPPNSFRSRLSVLSQNGIDGLIKRKIFPSDEHENVFKRQETYSNSRFAGIVSPAKRKPVRGFNPIFVKAVTPFAATSSALTVEFPPSAFSSMNQNPINFSVFTNLNAANDKIEEISGISESTKLAVNKDFNIESISYLANKSNNSRSLTKHVNYTPLNHLYQLKDSNIPATVLDILNHNKGRDASSSTDPSKIESQASISTSDNLPKRPMRLIGLRPIFIDGLQMQNSNQNFTNVPHLHIEALSNIQYATPMPLQSGPLVGGPLGPFRNIPRSVNEPSLDFPVLNAISLINPIPIQPDVTKIDNKGYHRSSPLCVDCLFPTNNMRDSVVKATISTSPTSATTPIPTTMSNTDGNQKIPCASNQNAARMSISRLTHMPFNFNYQ